MGVAALFTGDELLSAGAQVGGKLGGRAARTSWHQKAVVVRANVSVADWRCVEVLLLEDGRG